MTDASRLDLSIDRKSHWQERAGKSRKEQERAALEQASRARVVGRETRLYRDAVPRIPECRLHGTNSIRWSVRNVSIRLSRRRCRRRRQRRRWYRETQLDGIRSIRVTHSPCRITLKARRSPRDRTWERKLQIIDKYHPVEREREREREREGAISQYSFLASKVWKRIRVTTLPKYNPSMHACTPAPEYYCPVRPRNSAFVARWILRARGRIVPPVHRAYTARYAILIERALLHRAAMTYARTRNEMQRHARRYQRRL